MEPAPIHIKYWCPECKTDRIMELYAEHGPYFVYMCTVCGRTVLVAKGVVYNYAIS